MGRPKTQLRLNIEEFLADDSESADDWMSIQCKDLHEMHTVQSMVNNLIKRDYKIGAVDYDRATKICWIARKKETE